MAKKISKTQQAKDLFFKENWGCILIAEHLGVSVTWVCNAINNIKK